MRRHRIRPLAVIGLAAAVLALAGCSAASRLPYPKFSSVKRVTKKLLTNKEQEAAIEQMTLEKKKQREQAEQEQAKR